MTIAALHLFQVPVCVSFVSGWCGLSIERNVQNESCTYGCVSDIKETFNSNALSLS